MNDKDLHQLISTLDKPDITLPLQRQQLKDRLMVYRRPQQTPASRIGATLGNLKGVIMAQRKAFAKIGIGLAAVSVIAVGMFGYSLGYSPHAHAEQIVAKTITYVSHLTPAKQAVIDQAAHIQIISDLQAAEQANDLTDLSFSQVEAILPHLGGAHTPVGIASFSYLRYTADGDVYIIGVNKADQPVLTITYPNTAKASWHVRGDVNIISTYDTDRNLPLDQSSN